MHTHTHSHTHSMEYYSAIKRLILAICNNMGGPWEYYAKWNKPDRERQVLNDFPHMWNIINKERNRINEQTKWEQTGRYREQSMTTRGEGQNG